MKRLLLGSIIAGVLGVLLSIAPLSAATYHVYVSGNVISYGNNEIMVDRKKMTLSPGVKVAFHERRNGSFFEVKAKLSDVRIGQPVVVKAEGSTAYEILIERWRQ